jgi:hypothetical protein
MRRKQNIEEEVEKTLQALDDYEPVEANPYFLTRLMQRIEEEKKTEEIPKFSWVKVWQPALITTLVLVNAYTFYHFTIDINSDEGLSTLIEEYNYNSNPQSDDYANW